MRNVVKISIILCLAFLLVLSCTLNTVQTPPEKVTLQLKWVHQAQFAGYYAAKEKGYYAGENLEVNFLEGGPNVDIVQAVLSGQADFGVQSPDDILFRRSQGQTLVAISVIYRRSAVVFLSMPKSGIKRPQDFLGKKIACLGTSGSAEFHVQLLAVLSKLDLDRSRITFLPYDSNYASFLSSQADVTAAYSTGGLIRLRQQGLKPNTIWPSDYGIRFYSDALFTTEKMIAGNPGLVLRFLRASLRGWQDTIEDYRQTIAATLKYAREPDPQLQTAMLEAMLPMIHTGEDRLGWMKAEIWQEMYSVLNDQGLIIQPFDVNQAFNRQFLEQIYESN